MQLPSPDDTPAAQLAALQQAHAQLLHAVSHDLRAPLRHVTSFLPLLRESLQALQAGDAAAGGEAQEFMDTVEQAARRMGRMVDALLALSRVHSAVLRLQEVDFVALAREESARQRPGRPECPVVWHWPAAPAPVQADAQLLRQLLAALLDNALKFTQGRKPAHIGIHTERHSDGSWCLELQDNGAGFDSARATTLFALFQRQHRDSEFDGIGSGLALAHAIATRHGARLSASAQPGQGCRITLWWPPCRSGAFS